MEHVSSKSLTFLLAAAIIVFVGGIMVSVIRISRLAQQSSFPTGMAATGYVNVTIASLASLSVVEGQINFGSCSPNATIGSNLSSNITTDSWGAPGVCSQDGPDNITITNDGNTFVNISVQTDTLAASLIGGDDPWPPAFYFMARNATAGTYGSDNYGPGCSNRTGDGESVCIPPGGGKGGLQWGWKSFDSTSVSYCVCDNLSYEASLNAIYLFARLDVPSNASSSGGQRATLTLTATEI